MAEYQRILSNIHDRLKVLTKGLYDIDENTELVGHLNLESLQIMELILDIEDHFDVAIPISMLSDVRTVKDLVVKIEKLTRGEK
ncbi:MAG TPA: acyl carrier protein [Aeromonadales bacterium]|nr:acyl carrier protein [Aeromonadales bacterium]